MDSLLRCLDDQSNLLAEFIQLLSDEANVLLESPADQTLVELTTRKNDYARRLAELDQLRISELASLGFADDRDAIDAACKTSPDLLTAFNHLWDLAEQARTLNQQNGQILHTYIEHNQRALETLQSLLNTDLYDARGRVSR